MDSVKPSENGYVVTFVHLKQRAQLENSKFLIPRGEASNGVCLASIIQEYLEALAYDRVDTKGDSRFIRTGKKATGTKRSTFVNCPMGINTMYDVGKDIAEYLQLDNPDRYTGHAF